jgi:hypothetical protein
MNAFMLVIMIFRKVVVGIKEEIVYLGLGYWLADEK